MHILVIDDHPLFREGIKLLLTELADDLKISDSPCIEDVAKELFLQVDLVLLDLSLDKTNNADAMQLIKQYEVRGAIVIISSNDNPRIIKECIDKGAAGFIPKSADPEVLIPALKLILSGGMYLPPEAYQELPTPQAQINENPQTFAQTYNLTERQKVALQLACKGLQNKIIAHEMDIAESTVKLHLSAAFKALGVKNRTQAVYKLSSHGFTL